MAPDRDAIATSSSIHPICQAYWDDYLVQHDGQLPGRNAMIKALAHEPETTPWQVRRSWEALAATHRARLASPSLVPPSPEEVLMSEEYAALAHRIETLEAVGSRQAQQQSQDAALTKALMKTVERLEADNKDLRTLVEGHQATVTAVQQLLTALAVDDDSWRPVLAVLRQDGVGGRNRALRVLAQQIQRPLKVID